MQDSSLLYQLIENFKKLNMHSRKLSILPMHAYLSFHLLCRELSRKNLKGEIPPEINTMDGLMEL